MHEQLVSSTLQIILTNTKKYELPAWCWTDREMQQQQQTAAFSCLPEISAFSILLPFPHFFSLWISSIASAPYPLSLAFHARCFPPSISCFHSSPPPHFFPSPFSGSLFPHPVSLFSPTCCKISLCHLPVSLCARTVVSSVCAFSPGWERVCACVRASDHVSAPPSGREAPKERWERVRRGGEGWTGRGHVDDVLALEL